MLKFFLRLRRAGFHCEKLRPPASPAACEATKKQYKQLQMLGQNPLYSLTPIPYFHFFCICSTRASPHSDVTVIPQGIPWGFTLCSNKPKNQKTLFGGQRFSHSEFGQNWGVEIWQCTNPLPIWGQSWQTCRPLPRPAGSCVLLKWVGLRAAFAQPGPRLSLIELLWGGLGKVATPCPGLLGRVCLSNEA